MVRDLPRLAATVFDAAIVGGGIYGLMLARDLARRGVAVALVDRGDFGAATSFNSLKTIHGGIRPLQHGAIGEMRRFVRERRALARMAPQLVRPLPFAVPTARHPLRNRFAMRAFLAVYDRLAADRNRGVDPARHLPASRIVPRDECLQLNPFIDPAGVTGGAIWYDYQLHSPDRLIAALLQSAVNDGALVANYAEAVGLLRSGDRVTGVRARDVLGGTDGAEFDVRSRVVVNAAGPWAWRVLETCGAGPRGVRPPGFSFAMNLVLDRPATTHGLGGLSQGRFLFLIPWRDRLMAGSSHDAHDGGPDATRVTAAHVDRLLEDLARAFPRAAMTASDVRLVHRGLLPAVATGRRRGDLLKRSIVHDHAADGARGLVTMMGVRYTTARATAEAAAACVLRALGRSTDPGPIVPVAGGDIDDVDAYTDRAVRDAQGVPPAVVRRLVEAHGTGHRQLIGAFRSEPALMAPLAPDCDVTRGEVLHAVRQEMAVRLTDAIVRRTQAGAGGHPGAEAVHAAAVVMAAELGWSDARRAQEIAAVDAFYTWDG